MALGKPRLGEPHNAHDATHAIARGTPARPGGLPSLGGRATRRRSRPSSRPRWGSSPACT
eukprot:4789990-Prymnesium_polylepis.1